MRNFQKFEIFKFCQFSPPAKLTGLRDRSHRGNLTNLSNLGAQRLPFDKILKIFKTFKIFANRRRQQAPTDIPTSATPKIAAFQKRRFSVPEAVWFRKGSGPGFS